MPNLAEREKGGRDITISQKASILHCFAPIWYVVTTTSGEAAKIMAETAFPDLFIKKKREMCEGKDVKDATGEFVRQWQAN